MVVITHTSVRIIFLCGEEEQALKRANGFESAGMRKIADEAPESPERYGYIDFVLVQTERVETTETGESRK